MDKLLFKNRWKTSRFQWKSSNWFRYNYFIFSSFEISRNNDPKILSKYDNSKTLKSQQSFKFKIDELQNKNKNEEYKHNIGKISLPFCIYPNKHSYDKNIDNLNNQKEQDYFYRNNYTWNFRQIPEQEESKNNEINIIEENNILKTKPNNIDNIDQTTSNILLRNGKRKKINSNKYNVSNIE